MNELRFTKMEGTGNDFFLINNHRGELKHDWQALAKRYCHRRFGIGADGLIVLEPSPQADFTMRIFNADGSEAEMCGNGARCAAAFAVDQGIAQADMRFATLAGIITAKVHPDTVAIRVTEPHSLKTDITIEIESRSHTLGFVNTGVPHAILFTDDLENLPVDTLGRAIRRHSAFAPAGTNADFVQVVDEGRIKVRTYERGVEAETLACGTGATASAIISHACGRVRRAPVHVNMPGGELMIDFSLADGAYSDVWLIGAVTSVFNGTLRLNHAA